MKSNLKLKQSPIGPASSERGMVLLTVLVLFTALSLISLAAIHMATSDVRMSSEYLRSTQAFYAAEAGTAQAIYNLTTDLNWTGVQDILANDTGYAVAVTTTSPTRRVVRSIGTKGRSKRTLELRILTDALDTHCLVAGTGLHLVGSPTFAAEGVRIGKDAYLELGSGTGNFTVYRPATSTVYATGQTGGVQQQNAEALDLPALRLSRENWFTLKNEAHSSYLVDDDDLFLTADSQRTFNNLNFNSVSAGTNGHKGVVVDGDLTLDGNVSGEGSVVATGSVTLASTLMANGAALSIVAGSDVTIELDDQGADVLELYIYAEGDVTISGDVSFTGMIVAHGSVTILSPTSFQGVHNQTRWGTLGEINDIIDQPLRILSWEEVFS